MEAVKREPVVSERLPRPLDQNRANKIANELLTSQVNELDEHEREAMQERAQFQQQISNIDTQIRNLQERAEALKTDRARIEGASDYVWQKLIQYRHKKQTEDNAQPSASKSGGNGKGATESEGAAQPKEAAAEGEGGAKSEPVTLPDSINATVKKPKRKGDQPEAV